MVDVRLLHHLQELARVGRQAFHIAPLAFGIDGVEGERGLARAGETREHHEGVAWDFQIDVLEVVLACPADVNGLGQLGGGLGLAFGLLHEVLGSEGGARRQCKTSAR